jgi:hypothetical protein
VSRLLGALDAFWFAEGSAARLAVLRIAVGLAAFIYLGPRFEYFSEIADSSREVFEPAGLAALLTAPVPVPVFQGIMGAMLLANVAFILGWRFQWTGPLFAALLLWVLCYRNSWSMIYHTDNLLLWHVLILGLTRSADALSLDALATGSLFGPAATPAEGDAAALSSDTPRQAGWSWEYGYPVMLLCAVTAMTYFLSGVAKVAGEAGWGWALGDALRNQIAFDGLRKELIDRGATPLASALFNNVVLATAVGLGTLVIELGAPLALLDRRLRWLWAIATFGMHWGILAIMGITFWYHLLGVAFLPFVLEERIVARGCAMAERVLRRLHVLRRLRVTTSGPEPVPTGPAADPV